jgi:hypothetical protein
MISQAPHPPLPVLNHTKTHWHSPIDHHSLDTAIQQYRQGNNPFTTKLLDYNNLNLNHQSTIYPNSQVKKPTDNMYPGGYGNYGNYGGGYGGYGYGGGYNAYSGGGYGMNPYQSAQMQRANMQRAYQAQRQQAHMYRAQPENVRRVQNQYARQQQAYYDQADRVRAQQERYMRRAQSAYAEQGERNRESTQNAWMHRRQPRGRVDPESLQGKCRVLCYVDTRSLLTTS